MKNFNPMKKSHKKKLVFTLQLYHFFEKKEAPLVVIKYICENIYELIEETKYIDNAIYKIVDKEDKSENYFYNQYLSYYLDYYFFLEEEVKEDWLFTLFPPCYNNFSFRRFYEGLVGRITFLSVGDNIYRGEYWYDDPRDFTNAYEVAYLKKEKELQIKKCKFVVLDVYSDGQLAEKFGQIDNDTYLFILQKKHWYCNISDNSQDEYSGLVEDEASSYRKERRWRDYSTEDLESKIEQYKTNCTANYNPEVTKIFHKLVVTPYWTVFEKELYKKREKELEEVLRKLN